jgi:hypothetical protein
VVSLTLVGVSDILFSFANESVVVKNSIMKRIGTRISSPWS